MTAGSCNAKPSYRHSREKRALLHFGAAEHPGFYRDNTLKSLDPRLRGDDDPGETPRNPPTVIPAKAGIQGFIEARL